MLLLPLSAPCGRFGSILGITTPFTGKVLLVIEIALGLVEQHRCIGIPIQQPTSFRAEGTGVEILLR
jgi:hypothetical protein